MVICLKDKDNNEIKDINHVEANNHGLIRSQYLEQIVKYIRQENTNNLRDFIKPDKCPHFYHRYCLNFSCYLHNEYPYNEKSQCLLCKYGMTTRNFYLFDRHVDNDYYYFHLYFNDLLGVTLKRCMSVFYNDIYSSFKKTIFFIFLLLRKEK